MSFDSIVRVYDKKMNLIATFNGDTEGLSNEDMKNLMVAPTVHRETNGESYFTFQMLVNCEKWQLIKDPENIYELNDHFYTALNDGAYKFEGEGGVRVVNVQLVETWYLLDKKYTQAYNCGIYCYAKATFTGYTTDGATFRIQSTGCSNPSNTISNALAWSQVKLWSPKSDSGNDITYGILSSDEFKPKGWEDPPAGVFFTNFSVSGNTATVTIRARAKTQVQQNFDYSGNTYRIDNLPYPATIESVYVNSTAETKETGSEGQKYTRYTTSNKSASYRYSNGTITLTYSKASNETINSVIVTYSYYDLGTISSGATCTFAYGAEVVDEHTFAILPKANTKYKLTVNGVEYSDSQVKDSRGVVMPRGSGGYALWAALRDTGWSLGVCDVIAKGFDASIDYGCFNIESDMQDVLYNIQYIQELYGGILDWDSKNKVVNYRAENSDDYQAYNDGFNAWTGYEFREGKNMTDQPQITWDNEIITKGYLLGYGNLNVKKVNNGKTYVENYSYTSDVYEGYLEQSLIYDTRDDGGMKQLLYWGKKELAKKCKPRVNITAFVTDIRTAEGYEHEVFDLNDVVRCYYKDSETGEETYEEKRITLWEYNAFALWDCTVEIGDKTQNLVEVFKLIYNTAIDQAPKTNASGQISSDEIVIDVPDYEDIGLDFEFDFGDYEWVPGGPSGDGGGGGGFYGGGYGGGYGMSMGDYISLIARKTTDNSDAIAGLVLEATDLYAKAELFTRYQKVTEDMISDTYAGLTLYSDENTSALQLVVEGNYKELKKADEDTLKELGITSDTLKGEILRVETNTNAGFQAQQTKNEAFTRQFSELDRAISTVDGKLLETTRSLAYVETRVTANEASITSVAQLEKSHYDSVTGQLREHTTSIASVTQKATATEATVKANAQLETTHYNELTGKIDKVTTAQATFEATVTRDYAKTSQLSNYTTYTYVDGQIRNVSNSVAEVKTWATSSFASASLSATVTSISNSLNSSNSRTAGVHSSASTGASGTRIYATSNVSGSYVWVTGTNIYISPAAGHKTYFDRGIYMGSLTFGSYDVSWKSATISGTTINYLGR